MRKWKCLNQRCKCKCILELNNEFEPKNCVFSLQTLDASWVEIENTLTTTSIKLPNKLTRVFEFDNCPEWALYAAIQKDGNMVLFAKKPELSVMFNSLQWWTVNSRFMTYAKKLDTSWWKHSLVKRYPELPDWCTCGEWVYTCNADYRKVESIIDGIVHLSGGLNIPVGDIHNELVCARLRPFNSDEMKEMVGKIIDINQHKLIVHRFDVSKKTLQIGNYIDVRANDLLEREEWHINGKPCGVFEHLENGEWVQ